MISLSSLTFATRSDRGAPAAPLGSIAVAAFSRDRTLFDSGAAFGRNTASVPLTGTGSPGKIVEARALSVDDGGATSSVWNQIATIDAAGNWTGTISAPRSASWYRPEVRLKTIPSVSATGTARFGVGHVIAIWGQSEPDRILSTFQDLTTPPVLADNEAVQIIVGAAPGATRGSYFIQNGSPYSTGVAAMADTLIRSRPGEKFAVIFQTVPGTDPRALVNDSDMSRMWANDKALHDFATADGQKVGMAAMSWFAAPGNLGTNYGAALFPLFSGRMLDGTPVTFPATITYAAGQSYQADHWFGELYDYAQTRWLPYGPHRFEPDADLEDATHYVGGAVQANFVNKQAARMSWRSMATSPLATMFLPRGIDPLTYVNGNDDGAGGWYDPGHPTGANVDGRQGFGRLTAAAILKSAGLVTWPRPDFDNSLWEPSGAWVEVWSSAGPVTTTRIARGESTLGTAFTHWTAVMGFQINGQPARNAQIVAGRVRIYPNTGSFVSADVLTYGEGAATGALQFPEDMFAETWKNLPIVNLGVPGLTGIPVSAMPSPAALVNTIAPASQVFTTILSPSTYFVQPVAAADLNGSQMTVMLETDSITTPGSGVAGQLFYASNARVNYQILTSRNLRVTLRDSANAALINAVQYGVIPSGPVKIILSYDLVAKWFRAWVNGSQVANVTLATNTGLVDTGARKLSFLGTDAGVSIAPGTWKRLAVWKAASADGSEPSTNLLKLIAAPASVANADAWRKGANAT
ncbi:MAG TPA: hypothetical protein PLI43_18405 [Albidovulum sp.]|uniref:hypothetical protein n=1 Tax=Albidovulum sp. TaxID=1872424 RepID=UPI002CA8CB41|nr:hypothetical protein [Albidovulum sp.]